MILDYNDFVSQSEEYGMNTGHRKPDSESLFFHKREFCVFCNKKTGKIYSNPRIDTDTLPGVAWYKIDDVYVCSCGWWEHTFYGYLEGEREGFKDWAFEVDSAILRRYDVDSNQVPIQSLREYLETKSDDIYNIHHKKMEELVVSVLSDHFSCKAHIVGKTNDGGVDLILIESDHPIIVQVKRREKRNKVESVSQIRELIGATLLKGGSECIFVTTADHFSKGAIQSRNKALKMGIVNRIELIDFKMFIDLLQLYKKDNITPWEKLTRR